MSGLFAGPIVGLGGLTASPGSPVKNMSSLGSSGLTGLSTGSHFSGQVSTTCEGEGLWWRIGCQVPFYYMDSLIVPTLCGMN